MDFSEILNTWENGDSKKSSISQKKKKKDNSNKATMDIFLELYPPEEDKHVFEQEKIMPQRLKRKNYRRMVPQETLDLHGYKLLSAKVALEDFIITCKKKKIEKVLIIHGKGLHSESGDSVLRKAVRDYLVNNNDIGEIGHPSERDGGFGATWAIIRY